MRKPGRGVGIAKFGAGDFKGASSDLLRSIELKDDIYAMLFRYLARARAGAKRLRRRNLRPMRDSLTKEWPYAVIELYLGRRSPELMLDAAGKPDEQCVAQFFSGEWYILQNKSAEARAALRKVVETCPKTVTEYADALTELKRLKP